MRGLSVRSARRKGGIPRGASKAECCQGCALLQLLRSCALPSGRSRLRGVHPSHKLGEPQPSGAAQPGDAEGAALQGREPGCGTQPTQGRAATESHLTRPGGLAPIIVWAPLHCASWHFPQHPGNVGISPSSPALGTGPKNYPVTVTWTSEQPAGGKKKKGPQTHGSLPFLLRVFNLHQFCSECTAAPQGSNLCKHFKRNIFFFNADTLLRWLLDYKLWKWLC